MILETIDREEESRNLLSNRLYEKQKVLLSFARRLNSSTSRIVNIFEGACTLQNMVNLVILSETESLFPRIKTRKLRPTSNSKVDSLLLFRAQG